MMPKLLPVAPRPRRSFSTISGRRPRARHSSASITPCMPPPTMIASWRTDDPPARGRGLRAGDGASSVSPDEDARRVIGLGIAVGALLVAALDDLADAVV